MREDTAAVEQFVWTQARIEAICESIMNLSEEHFDLSPAEIDGTVNAQLQRIADSLQLQLARLSALGGTVEAAAERRGAR